VRKRLKEVASQSRPFVQKFDQVAVGPTSRKPRVIWAVGPASKELSGLRRKLWLSLGQKPDRRAFVPHVTLARFAFGDAARFPVESVVEPVNWVDRVSSIVLLESRLLPTGAEYQVLGEFTLGV
jgi:2'-5' RNA ligase